MMTEERSGLYYPYVHFRDDEWLKKALLVFPSLLRMVADDQVPNDSVLVKRLTGSDGGFPLIQNANLHTYNVGTAQECIQRLIQEDLDKDAKAFIDAFGPQASKAATVGQSQPTFQMNLGKTSAQLGEFLRQKGLAWAPDVPDQHKYSELHPRLGTAVLGAIAVACSKDAGLHIVTSAEDQPSRELNVCLAGGNLEQPYRHFVRRESLASSAHSPNADSMLELVVHLGCDTAKLDAGGLRALSGERDALRSLKAELQSLAATIPRMDDLQALEQRMRDETSRILTRWRQDQMNLSKFAKSFFSIDKLGAGGGELLKTAMDKFGPTLPAAGAGMVAGTVLGASAGLAIGVLVHGATTYAKLKDRQDASPFRYLTQAEKHGVVFYCAP